MTGRRLRPHQRRALAFIESRGGHAGLFMAPGTGKTLTAIRWAHGCPGPTLVICRRDDFLTWRKELYAEGLPRPFEFTDGKTRLAMTPQWCLVTYGLMRSTKVMHHLAGHRWANVIADESHHMRSPKSKTSKMCFTGTRHIKRRLALTGTFMGNQVDDVFQQAKWIDDGLTFGKSHWGFMQRYHLRLPSKAWVLKRGAKELITAKLRTLAFVVEEDDVLTLPPKRYLIKSAPMSPFQIKHYLSILDDWETDLTTGETIELDIAAARTDKLRQIASGFIYDSDHKARVLRCPKYDLLKRDVQERISQGKQTVVWANYKQEIDRLAHDFAGDAAVLRSGNPRLREEAREAFAAGMPVFIAQADAGVGMNELVVADTACYLSNSYRVISREQSERRTRRIGSEHHDTCTYIDYISEGSLDLYQLEALREKTDVVRFITNRLRSHESSDLI